MFRVLSIIALLIVAGCQTTAQAPRNPEVTIYAPPEKVKPVVIADLVGDGFQIKSDSPYLLVLDRPSANLAANVLLGSSFNPIINARLSITFIPIDQGTRVVVNMAAVTNPGSAFEKLTPLTGGKDVETIQQWLGRLPSKVESSSEPAEK